MSFLKESLDIKQNQNKMLAAMAAAIIFAIVRIMCKDLPYSIEKNIFTIVIFYFPFYYSIDKFDKKTITYTAIFTVIFSFFIYHGNWYPKQITSYIVLLPFVFLLTLGTINICKKIDIKDKDIVINKKVWLYYFLFITAIWSLMFLATGPLKLSQDSSTVVLEALGKTPLTDACPVIYTLLVRVFLLPFEKLGIIIVGAYLFGVFQLCVISGILSYSLYYIEKQGMPRVLVWLGALYFTLTPVFLVNAITLWKDIPYNAMLLVIMIQIYEIVQTKGEKLKDKKFILSLAISSLLACFLRSNGFFIVAAVAIVLLIVYKPHRNQLAVLFLPMLIAVKIITGPVYDILGISNLGAVEAQAMPLQMVARAIVEGAELTDEQQQIIENVIPIEKLKQVYLPASVDFIKFDESFNVRYFNDNTGKFLKVWLQLAPRNIKSYLSAWLDETLGYWKLGFRVQTTCSPDKFDGFEGIANKDIIFKFTGVDAANWLYARTDFIAPSFFCFFTIFTALYFICIKKSNFIIALLPLLLTWLGLMIGAPTYAEFRYILVFPYAFPFSVFMLLNKTNNKDESKNQL